MLKMIDCKECVWGSDCHAHLAGIAACPVGERKPEAWELPQAVPGPLEGPEPTPVPYDYYEEQAEAFRAAYAR